MQDILDLADRFFAAVEAGDIETVRDCYDARAAIWHNTDDLEQTRDENLATLRGMALRISDRRYEVLQREVFPGGFVQRHNLHGTRQDGVRLTLHACILCKVENGRITRLDEYFDSAQVAEFRKFAN
ncbi:nuclear transport factor 2 family protein [Novosphingobium sp.]|uniref:nuclear transport factor 2 family protein n=1 Tax=Novosphingobium sp. TaxID=1874826 RepID=UPI0027363DC7|nr:nuclear transport factor 2 family protein [Novosphingobium sp.]MDP3908578.1 nuclear transport factor 2 family protein [Novosphingobium sp.]